MRTFVSALTQFLDIVSVQQTLIKSASVGGLGVAFEFGSWSDAKLLSGNGATHLLFYREGLGCCNQ